MFNTCALTLKVCRVVKTESRAVETRGLQELRDVSRTEMHLHK